MIHTDHLGTPHKMTDANQAVVWSAYYKPFGAATITISTITNNLRFPGQYYDAETALNQNWFREYNNMIGRYVEADPIGLNGGINQYNYAKANPVRFVDPKGLMCRFNVYTAAGAKLLASASAGGATADCDCVNHKKTSASYIVIGGGISGGVDIEGVPINFSASTSFTTNDSTPPSYVNYFQVNGPSVGFGVCFGLGDFQVSVSSKGPGQGKPFITGEPCPSIGASLFEFSWIHLIKMNESSSCCN
jgi:RHS repeat-associated protein